jgi:plastocyanin
MARIHLAIKNKRQIFALGLGLALVFGATLVLLPAASAQQVHVTAQISIAGTSMEKKSSHSQDLSNVVVWLSPMDGRPVPRTTAFAARSATIAQENKSFTPHISAVQVGSSVQFPNHDHVLHNVFSLHEGRQFDLGFYEAGSVKTVRFDRPGISYLFCNIHPEMTAALVVVDSPYFALSDASGHVNIAGVAEGKYILHVWSEQSLPESLAALKREVTISSNNANLGTIKLHRNEQFPSRHKNKYGQDYIPTPSDYSNPASQ